MTNDDAMAVMLEEEHPFVRRLLSSVRAVKPEELDAVWAQHFMTATPTGD